MWSVTRGAHVTVRMRGLVTTAAGSARLQGYAENHGNRHIRDLVIRAFRGFTGIAHLDQSQVSEVARQPRPVSNGFAFECTGITTGKHRRRRQNSFELTQVRIEQHEKCCVAAGGIRQLCDVVAELLPKPIRIQVLHIDSNFGL